MLEFLLEVSLGVVLMAAPIYFDLSHLSGRLFWGGSALVLLFAVVRFVRHGRASQSPGSRLVPDISLGHAVESILGKTGTLGHGEKHVNDLLDLLRDIGQAAAYGTLTVWGRPKQNEVSSLAGIKSNSFVIPQGYWANHVIDEIAFMADQNGKTRTDMYDEVDSYEDLSFAPLR